MSARTSQMIWSIEVPDDVEYVDNQVLHRYGTEKMAKEPNMKNSKVNVLPKIGHMIVKNRGGRIERPFSQCVKKCVASLNID